MAELNFKYVVFSFTFIHSPIGPDCMIMSVPGSANSCVLEKFCSTVLARVSFTTSIPCYGD